MGNSRENFGERIGQSRSLVRVKSEILERILKKDMGRVCERCREDEGLDGLKGMEIVKSM